MNEELKTLIAECELIYPKMKKKKHFGEVHEFWNKNEQIFDNNYYERINNQESILNKFIKEYSSILLIYLITSAHYEGNIKNDIEHIYNYYLKNISNFGGGYIIYSYLLISNYNNLDQLKYDENYILENISKAKNGGVPDRTISELCKSYITKTLITGIYNEAKESKLWEYLDDEGKKYFIEMKVDEVSEGSTGTAREKVDDFMEITGSRNLLDEEELQKYDNAEIFDEEAEQGETEEDEEEENEEFTEEDEEEENEEFTEEDDNEYDEEEAYDTEQDNKVSEITKLNYEEDSKKIDETEESIEPKIPEKTIDDFDIDDKESKKNIDIVVISSDTQMDSVRKAYTQNRLDEQAKLKGWPITINFKKDVRLIDGWSEAPNTSIKTIARYDLIIIGQNHHQLKDMPKEYSAGNKKDGGIKKCLQEVFNIGEGRVYFPEKNKRPDLSVNNLRLCLCDFMDRRSSNKTIF